ncbi:MAG: DNA helicase RecQ [Deltaproteobacteria bacterium]|nr:DNA helicase RecQ [Deltaproteobacteria bacterium]
MNLKVSQPQSILKKIFGYDTFWPLQGEIISHLLDRKDALVVMPTGGGKSLCYQIPALIFDGLTIVVSPLISLMKDQVDQLRECGVPSLFLNSTLSIEEYRHHVSKLKANSVKLLYIAPEALLAPRTLALLSSMKVDCIAIDEAHCISEWGHDFRPEYRQLAEVRTLFPDAVCVALTATATSRVRKDIKESLHIGDHSEYIGSFNRPNLFLEVAHKTEPIDQVLSFLKQYPNESGIIYCATRQQTEDLHAVLLRKGYSVLPYHAGLLEKMRTENQERFSRDDTKIIVATIAFGMGINKSNIRFVIHYDLPWSIDTYYQEIGRAGRDGLPAHCLLLFGYGDIHKAKYFIEQKSQQEQRVANILLNTLVGYAETDLCRRIPLLNYFGEVHTLQSCGMCDNCLTEEKDLVDITIPAQMFLSCAKRTGESFGAGHIIDVLRGSTSQKVLKFGHDRLSTYGIGKSYSAQQWRHLSRQCIQKGLLNYEYTHGTLKLTPKAWEVMRGKETVLGRLETAKKERDSILKKREEATEAYDPLLFEALRKKRKEIADRANLPPYMIFQDWTLREMAVHLPRSLNSLAMLYGIGASKLEKYGKTFLVIIEEYCQTHQIPDYQTPATSKPMDTPSPASATKRETAPPAGGGSRRHLITGEHFNRGRTIAQLAVDFNIRRDTVLNHLYQCWREDCPLEADRLLSQSPLTIDQQQAVFASFGRFGTERLRPVFERLDGKISYEDLKLLRLFYLLSCHDAPATPMTFVCLAASRKYGGYCIAGKEWEDGRIGPWIRPVSRRETGELSISEIRMSNGTTPQCLDIITIPIQGPAGHPYQKENVLIGKKGPWNWQWKLPYVGLSRLVDKVENLWLNGFHSENGLNDRIPEEIVNEGNNPSLYLIRPDQFTVIVSDDLDGRKKVSARFDYRNTSYLLAVTDPVMERKYLMKDHGEYPFTTGDLYTTISLGEPFNGYCYKLLAAVMIPEA